MGADAPAPGDWGAYRRIDRGLAHLAPVIRAEYERWDGKGYPDGLKGEEIPLASRIVFACDAFHAMTSDRPYRKSIGVRAALEELKRNLMLSFAHARPKRSSASSTAPGWSCKRDLF